MRLLIYCRSVDGMLQPDVLCLRIFQQLVLLPSVMFRYRRVLDVAFPFQIFQIIFFEFGIRRLFDQFLQVLTLRKRRVIKWRLRTFWSVAFLQHLRNLVVMDIFLYRIHLLQYQRNLPYRRFPTLRWIVIIVFTG